MPFNFFNFSKANAAEISEGIKLYPMSEKVYFISKRFASKEALSKALGTGISGGVSFLDFEVSHNDFGARLARVRPHALPSNEAMIRWQH